MRIITSEQALEILRRTKERNELQRCADDMSNASLAAMFNVSRGTIDRAIAGHRMARGKASVTHSKLNEVDVSYIRHCVKERAKLRAQAAKHSVNQMAKDYGLSPRSVQCIASGDRWQEAQAKFAREAV